MEIKKIFDQLPEGFRIATEEDLPLVILTFAQAFADYKYPMPSTEISYSARLKMFYELFTTMVNNGMKHGIVFTNEDFSAVMVTVPYSKAAIVPIESLTDALSKNSTPADGANLHGEFSRVGELEEKIRFKKEPLYVECFAVQTPRQGQKLGSKLMRQLFEQCKKHNEDILLYTNTDRNRSIYEHFGYECILEDYVKDLDFKTFFMFYNITNENK